MPLRTRLLALCALALLVSFIACMMPFRYPREGEPVSIRSGEALVFGRIRMVSEGPIGTESRPYEFRPFSRDPMDHMLPPDPLMSLELRRFEAPGGPFVYKTYLRPAVRDDGSFSWILPAGEYSLASNPRGYGSKRFDPGETETLARFTVSAGDGTLYLGTLVVTISFDISEFLRSWELGDVEYGIPRLRVADRLGEELPALRGRFPTLPEPLVTRLMSGQWETKGDARGAYPRAGGNP